jgi:hypothetical protein
VIKLIRDNEVKNMIDKMRFIKLFRKRLFKKLRKKYISFEMSNYTYKVMKEEIEKVYDKINNFEYNPDPAIQNILFAKSAYNYREIVDLNPIDEYLYWFLAVEIIKDAPNLRVEIIQWKNKKKKSTVVYGLVQLTTMDIAMTMIMMQIEEGNITHIENVYMPIAWIQNISMFYILILLIFMIVSRSLV